MSTVPAPSSSHRNTSTPKESPQLLGLAMPDRSAAVWAELSMLALHLAHTAHVPAVMLVAEPDADPSRRIVISTERTGDDSPIPILSIGGGVLYGPPNAHTGRAAAGALAHALTCHQQTPTPLRRWLGHLADLALMVLLAALLGGWNRIVLIAGALWLTAWLAILAGQRRSEYLADRSARQLLQEAGLDGRSCLLAMLYDVAAHESRTYQRCGWIISGLPTAAARITALTRAPRARPPAAD
ncbi:hypothetical protein [Planobispora takensis]|uniref:Uncharacterized protein n=1 Tax=Planobispora takensis TaxID=1367882 RepID=A0A8J3WXQ5_9ACTN|nr:hypothetical protein [Planobispora takensis]GII03097.1 hypothetical protein Pta02_51050 [Planobispora takensis]